VRDEFSISNVAADERGAVRNAVSFACGEVVEDAHVVLSDEGVDDVTPDEAGTAGDEGLHVASVSGQRPQSNPAATSSASSTIGELSRVGGYYAAGLGQSR